MSFELGPAHPLGSLSGDLVDGPRRRRLVGDPGRLDSVEAEAAPAVAEPAPSHEVPVVAAPGEPKGLDQARRGAVPVPVHVVQLEDLAAQDGGLDGPNDGGAGQLSGALEEADAVGEVAGPLPPCLR